jgi:urate oxidase
MLKSLFKYRNTVLIGTFAKNYITDLLALIYEVSTTFIIVCTEAKEIQIHSPYKSSWIIPICEEMTLEIEAAELYLSEIMEQYQEIVVSIHTKRASMEILEY